ncbi:MAG: mechanosensitive ion channel [Ruminococcaceae bacterium]|nr:mechanosensitive ion channel [Oscillospiraceae bacterium]
MIKLISTASATAEAVTAEATKETTAADAIEDLVASTPEEAISQIGKFFQGLLDSIISAIPTVLIAILVLIVGMIFCKLALRIMSKGLERSKADITVVKFAKQCAKIILYVLLLIVVLSILGIPTTSIITVIGTAGVAIGLALQDSLSNVAGGFLLMITKPFKIGDYIIVNGVEGVVAQISILHTRLTSGTNQAIFIPNGQAVNATVTNNSVNGTRRVDMTFSIAYDDDYEKARQLILDILAANDKVLKDPEPTVRMVEHGASAIIIATRPWTAVEDYWEVYFGTLEAVRRAFIENDISIPFDQLDVHVVKE